MILFAVGVPWAHGHSSKVRKVAGTLSLSGCPASAITSAPGL